MGIVRVLQIVHESEAGPGVFGEVLAESRVELVTWQPPSGAQPPAEPEQFDAILTFGGSMNPDEDREHPWLPTEKRFLKRALAGRVPTLAVCLGAELLAIAAGAPARRAEGGEIGWHQVELTGAAKADPIFGPLPGRFDALEWHGYELVLPSSATELARSRNCVQAFRIGRHAWAIQFHAEATEEDFSRWLAQDGSGEQAVALGIDPIDLADQTRELIADWNALGRGLFSRFLDTASSRMIEAGGVPRTE